MFFLVCVYGRMACVVVWFVVVLALRTSTHRADVFWCCEFLIVARRHDEAKTKNPETCQ